MPRIVHPQWRDQNADNKYPFAERASLRNASGLEIPTNVFVDAALYPLGEHPGMYLSAVEVEGNETKFFIGDRNQTDICNGSLRLPTTNEVVELRDAQRRPAGVLVVDPTQLAAINGWGDGRHEFTPDQTPWAATVCFPAPVHGVSGFLLDDGTVLSGPVWLVGGAGVVLRYVTVQRQTRTGTQTVPACRVDVVGDPLFRRRLCAGTDLFATPRFVRTVRVIGPNGTFECQPGPNGEFTLLAGNDLADDSVLRIVSDEEGIRFGMVGPSLEA